MERLGTCEVVGCERCVIGISFSALYFLSLFFFLIIRRPPRSTQSRSSAASDVYKRQDTGFTTKDDGSLDVHDPERADSSLREIRDDVDIEKEKESDPKKKKDLADESSALSKIIDALQLLSLIHISEPTRPY